YFVAETPCASEVNAPHPFCVGAGSAPREGRVNAARSRRQIKLPRYKVRRSGGSFLRRRRLNRTQRRRLHLRLDVSSFDKVEVQQILGQGIEPIVSRHHTIKRRQVRHVRGGERR